MDLGFRRRGCSPHRYDSAMKKPPYTAYTLPKSLMGCMHGMNPYTTSTTDPHRPHHHGLPCEESVVSGTVWSAPDGTNGCHGLARTSRRDCHTSQPPPTSHTPAAMNSASDAQTSAGVHPPIAGPHPSPHAQHWEQFRDGHGDFVKTGKNHRPASFPRVQLFRPEAWRLVD